MQFLCLPFDQLSLDQLYAIMALRQEVFVVEQNCPYLDADGKDMDAHHLMGIDEKGQLLAYTRLLPKGISYEKYVSIGRVVTSPKARGTGLGKQLMEESIKQAGQIFPPADLKISAQCYLIKFYESLGFQSIGESYLEDDIPHIAMIKKQA
jgi:ElaA protein